MNSIMEFLKGFYTGYTMLLVVGAGLVSYFVDYKKMVKQNQQKEAKLSKYIGLTYIWGGILLYVVVLVIG